MTLLRRQHPVRALLLKGNYFVGSVVSATLTKLALRMAAVHGATSQTAKSVMADAVLVMSAILELGQSPVATSQIDQVRAPPPPSAHARVGLSWFVQQQLTWYRMVV